MLEHILIGQTLRMSKSILAFDLTCTIIKLNEQCGRKKSGPGAIVDETTSYLDDTFRSRFVLLAIVNQKSLYGFR